MASHNDIENELRELGQRCSTVHYLDLQSVYLVTYPVNGAFHNHLAMGCGATQQAAMDDYSQKLDIAIESMNLGQKTTALERIKQTRKYQEMDHLADAG